MKVAKVEFLYSLMHLCVSFFKIYLFIYFKGFLFVRHEQLECNTHKRVTTAG